MVMIVFGLPGCGKTTYMTYLAMKLRNKYRNIRSNVPINLDYVKKLDVDWLGEYAISDTLLLIDEGTIVFDSRDHKNFGPKKTEFFMMHRHWDCDVIIFVQRWDAVDLKIRSVTEQVFYIYRPLLTGKWFSKVVRVPYKLVWPTGPDGKPVAGDISMGYVKPSPLLKLTGRLLFRPKYYPYFDTHLRPDLPPIPDYLDSWTPSRFARRARRSAPPAPVSPSFPSPVSDDGSSSPEA